jgi:CRISPR-associated protein Csm4
MNNYRITIRPRSPFSTPFNSDTLFGHLCWALRYNKGEDTLRKFLERLKKDPSIFVLSSAFPSGHLPRPNLKPLSVDEEEELRKSIYSSKNGSSLAGFASMIKRVKKMEWIPFGTINKLKNGLSSYHLYMEMMKVEEDLQKMWVESDEWHNAKNRKTNHVLKGLLFAKEVTFYKTEFEVYQTNSYFNKKDLTALWELIGEMGYGADSSTGKGNFIIDLEEYELEGAEEPNGFILLSHTIPSVIDPRNGYYEMLTKFGKLGGTFASTGNVFKHPVIMLFPGATFFDHQLRPVYGSIVEGIHHDYRDVVQYGLGLPFPVRLL